ELWRPQSLYGTPSRPTVQSSRGSTGSVLAAVKLSLSAFHAAVASSGSRSPTLNASGSPLASTLKKFTRFWLGWLKPQQPNGLPECGKFNRSPEFDGAPFGSPAFTAAWYARIVSGPFW